MGLPVLRTRGLAAPIRPAVLYAEHRIGPLGCGIRARRSAVGLLKYRADIGVLAVIGFAGPGIALARLGKASRQIHWC